MNILFTTSIYLPHIGGIEKYVFSLANYFSKTNSITIITADTEIATPVIEEKNFRIIRLPAYSLAGIIILKKKSYFEIVNRELMNANIVHSNDCKFLYSYLAKMKNKYDYKLLLSSHGFIFHTKNHFLLKKLFFKQIVAKKQNFYDKFICVSEQDECIAKEYKIQNTCKIYPGVDIYKFADIPDAYNENEICFMYWGRIAPNKGILQCLRKLATLNFDFKAVFIGKADDEKYLNEINNILKETNLNQKVSFVGPKTDEEIKEQISRSNYILMPSLHEGFGMTLVECLLSRRKIIANTNTSFNYILKAVNAEQYLFNFEDENSNLAMKIDELKNACIEPKNVEEFSDTAMYKKIEAIYLEGK